MNSCCSNLYGYQGVENSYGSLEGRQVGILIWKHSELARLYPQADTCGYVFLGRFKPCITQGLCKVEYFAAMRTGTTYRAEDPVKDCVVRIVVRHETGCELLRLTIEESLSVQYSRVTPGVRTDRKSVKGV